MELSPIGTLNKDITENESKLEKIQEVVDYDKHLDTLFTVYYSVGRSLESQRVEIAPDSMGATSADLNLHMQETIYRQCLNVNSLSEYLNGELNCSKVYANYAFFDNSELMKLRQYEANLIDITATLKGNLSELKADRQGVVDNRNFLYVIFVFLSSFSIALKFYVEKLYASKLA
jgi:hypothetical protein